MNPNPDRAIEHRADDKLGRRDFANEIALGIANSDASSSLVVGLYGSWGSGKSSILNMVAEALKFEAKFQGDRPVVLRFNPWMYSEQGDLVRQFFLHIGIEVGIEDTHKKLKTVSKAFRRMSMAMVPLSVLPTMGPYATALGEVLQAASAVLDATAEMHRKDLDTQKKALVDALQEVHQRFVILIDDVDRLTADETRQIFMLAKSLADLPYVTYVIAFDNEVVAEILDEATCNHGRDFLGKIVQLPFHVPTILPRQLRKPVIDRINQLIQEDDAETWDQRYWDDLEFDAFWISFRTPRDVTRYLNVLDFNWARLKHETNLVDLLCLTSIQVFHPSTFKWIGCNKGLLTQDIHWLLRSGQEEKRKEKVQKRFAEHFESKEEPVPIDVANLVRQIFPLCGKLIGYVFTSASESELRTLKRVGSSDNFDRYFRFSLDEGEVTATELGDFLSAANDDHDLTEFLCSKKAKSEDLLDRFEDMLGSVDEIQSRVIVSVLLTIGDEFMGSEKRAVIGGPSGTIKRIVHDLVHKLQADQRETLIVSALRKDECALYLPCGMLRRWASEHDEHRDGYIRDPADRTVDAETVAMMKKLLSTRLREDDNAGKFATNRYRNQLAFDWYYNLEDSKLASAAVRRFCDTDDQLMDYLQAIADYPYQLSGVMVFFEGDTLRQRLYRIKNALAHRGGATQKVALIDRYLESFIEDRGTGVS